MTKRWFNDLYKNQQYIDSIRLRFPEYKKYTNKNLYQILDKQSKNHNNPWTEKNKETSQENQKIIEENNLYWDDYQYYSQKEENTIIAIQSWLLKNLSIINKWEIVFTTIHLSQQDYDHTCIQFKDKNRYYISYKNLDYNNPNNREFLLNLGKRYIWEGNYIISSDTEWKPYKIIESYKDFRKQYSLNNWTEKYLKTRYKLIKLYNNIKSNPEEWIKNTTENILDINIFKKECIDIITYNESSNSLILSKDKINIEFIDFKDIKINFNKELLNNIIFAFMYELRRNHITYNFSKYKKDGFNIIFSLKDQYIKIKTDYLEIDSIEIENNKLSEDMKDISRSSDPYNVFRHEEYTNIQFIYNIFKTLKIEKELQHFITQENNKYYYNAHIPM